MIDGQAHVTNWLEVIFNPSFPYKMTHMLLASGLTGAFMVAGISAYRWLKDDRSEEVVATLRSGVWVAAILIPLQIIAGDAHGLNTLEHQPAKLAAMEGIWETQREVPAVLFAIPDEKTQSNHFEIAIPKLASLYLTHTWDGEVKGLKELGRDHPPVAAVFFAFRLMVGVGLLMLFVSWSAAFMFWRNTALKEWVIKAVYGMTFSGWLAMVAGWYVTEVGRQPWLVFGLLRTDDAASLITSGNIELTLVTYLLLYLVLFTSFVTVVFHLAKKAIHPGVNHA